MRTTSYKQASKNLAVLALFVCLFITKGSAQNLITNPGFENGTTGWITDCTIEINPENVYGGTSTTNRVTEIDVERCFNQQVNVTAGSTYYITYKASRRQGGSTPATVGVNVRITGVQSGTQYINVNRTYTNTSWSYTIEVFSFTLPLNTTDTKVNVKFSNYVTVGTYGTLIDDVSVTTGSAGILPLKFISFNGKIKNASAVLNWTASNDDQSGRYFVIERSYGQNKFDSIGIVKANDSRADYTFTDNNFSNGVNYYRIKAVNANEVISFSSVIALNGNAAIQAKVYPNPAVSNIAVSLPASANTIANVQIYNLAGSLLISKHVSLKEGSNVVSVDITTLKPGSFFVKVADNNGLDFAQPFCKR
ncbi:MAG: T9SS type A sorting domain-containing protein [Chitinophagaceae bacterium]|nr:T9SS type A sorting domain-containing protein [Chitinophagaceae bacterium]